MRSNFVKVWSRLKKYLATGGLKLQRWFQEGNGFPYSQTKVTLTPEKEKSKTRRKLNMFLLGTELVNLFPDSWVPVRTCSMSNFKTFSSVVLIPCSSVNAEQTMQ